MDQIYVTNSKIKRVEANFSNNINDISYSV